MPKFAEATGDGETFFTFDLVDDGAVELGVGSSQVLQVPGGMLSAWG